MNRHCEIPEILTVNGHDRFNYTLKHFSSNIQIQAVVSFGQCLDVETLRKAVRLSLDAEPVLGCRFIEDEKQPYWQRFATMDEMPWFEFGQEANRKESVEQFLKSPFSFEGQQLNVRLIRTQEGDSLCVKICHACSDAGGLKQYLQLLAEIYSNLLKDPNYKPVPNTEGRRDQQHYFTALGIKDPLALFNPQAQVLPPTWAFPYHDLEYKEMHIAMRQIKEEAFEKIIAFGKTHGVTVNTIILAALYRSLFELIKPESGEEMGVGMTMDLRQAFNGRPNQAICNLSTTIEPRIPKVDQESFMETLTRLSESIAGLKNTRPDLSSAVVMEVLGAMDYSQYVGIIQAVWQQMTETGKSDPTLSNMGIISPLQFGQILANDAYIVTPRIYAPGFLVGVSTYNKTMTLEVSYCEPAHRREEVEALLDYITVDLCSL
ncbi:MAG: condensation domain-containing protein [Syntrophomonadaceae bacterium]